MGEFVMHERRSGRTATRTWWWPIVALAATLVVTVPAVASSATLYSQTDKLVASDGAAYDWFGQSVAVDGDTIVVGAPGADASHGAVYVHTPDGGGGITTTRLVPPDGPDGMQFRFGQSVAVDSDTNTIVVGAFGADASRGAAYVFTPIDGVYTHTAKLTASNTTTAFFGISVAVDGNTIVVGAPTDYNGGGSLRTGAAYVFTPNGDGYIETAKLFASDGALHDNFGVSVAVDSDTIVVGAESHNEYAGAAYVFTPDGDGVYTQAAKLVASDGGDFDGFGLSVAVDGDTIVVGAPGAETVDAIEAGAAYVFTPNGGGVYTETAKLFDSDGATGDWFGGAVAVDGDTVVVGASSGAYNKDEHRIGAAYVFTPNVGVYIETAKLFDSDGATRDWFGESVAVDGDTIVVGAAGANTGTGAAYVFTAASDTDTDADGDGVADDIDECEDTELPDVATRQLRHNRYETVVVDGSGVFVDPSGNVIYTLADTRGCSLSQIVEGAGLGQAHLWFGITRSALDGWVAG